MKTTGLIAAVVTTLAFATVAVAEEVANDPVMLATLKTKYPKTTFKSVTTTKLPGIYEVVMGKNVAYVEESGRYFLFGHLFDMETQTDLTEGKAQPDLKVGDFSKLPIGDAIVTVRGDGSRKMAVFSDPDCPYCKQLENMLAGINNVTVYTFLMPLQQLHPQAKAKAVGVWCAQDRTKAWDDLMQRNVVASGNCENPVDRNIALAESMGINGTPTIILADGTMIPGAPSAGKLEQMLAKVGESGKVVKK